VNLSTVGYDVAKKRFSSNGGVQEFEIVLTPDTLAQTDTIDVRATRERDRRISVRQDVSHSAVAGVVFERRQSVC